MTDDDEKFYADNPGNANRLSGRWPAAHWRTHQASMIATARDVARGYSRIVANPNATIIDRLIAVRCLGELMEFVRI